MSYDPSIYYSGESLPPPLPSPRTPNDDVYLRPISSPPPTSPAHVTTKSSIGSKFTKKVANIKGDTFKFKKKSVDSDSPPALPARDHPHRQSSIETTPKTNFPLQPKAPPVVPTTPRPPQPLPSSHPKPPRPHKPSLSNKAPPPPPPSVSDVSSDDETYVDLEHSSYHPSSCPINPDVDGLSFLSFVDQYKDKFPIAFTVTMGYSGRGEEASISEGERFVAHFQRRTRIYTLETENKDIYCIPLNTSFDFAVLYDPNNNKKEALRGFIYKTAGDMMLLRTLPKVIRAKKHFRGISPDSSVEINELLFVMEVVQRNVERSYIKCISGNTGKEKQLHKECNGDFTTSPHEIKTYLPEILQHFQVPLRVMMCLGIDNTEDITASLISATVTITQSHIVESVVASSISDEHEMNGEYVTPDDLSTVFLNDIPITFDINLHTMPISPLNTEKLIENTKSLFDNFNPVGVYPYLTSYAVGQHALMKSLRKDENSKIGVELIEPPSIQKLRTEQTRYDSTSADSLKELSKFTAQLQDVKARQERMEAEMKEMVRVVQSSPGQDTKVTVTGLQRECQQLRGDVIRLKQTVNELHKTIDSKFSESVI